MLGIPEGDSEVPKKLRDTTAPAIRYALFGDRPVARARVAQETAGRLRHGLTEVAEQARSGPAGEPALTAAEQAQKVRDFLVAYVFEEWKATVAAEQSGAANAMPASVVAEEARDHPARASFALTAGPGGRVVAQVSPKPVPATLLVAASSSGEVRVTGVARWFPAHTIHAEDGGTVVAGNNCTLTSTDHVHVRTVSVSLAPLTRPGSPGQAALAALVKDPTGTGIDRFQGEMRRLRDAPAHGESQVSLPARQPTVTIVSGATAVRHGTGARANITTDVVIEQVRLPACELFADDRALVNAFIEAVHGPEGGPEARGFGREALRAAGCVSDLALLDHSTELHGAETSVFRLFGVDAASRAPATIGSGDTLRTGTRVEQGRHVLGGGLADLDRVRQDASRLRYLS